MGGFARLRGLSSAIGVLLGCACAVLGFASTPLAGAAPALHTVRYHGYSVRVPRSWPVFNLAGDRTSCVRFNRHALYLGTPGPEERCPAHSVGRTGAILVSPVSSQRGAATPTAGGLLLEGDATSFRVSSARVEVTATWSGTPRLVAQALGRKSLRGTDQGAEGTGATTGTSTNSRDQPSKRATAATVYTGLGFDACAAPSVHDMKAWSSSPYRAVGIYVGGPNASCAQANLTKGWVGREMASGWHPIPTYVSLQAPHNACGCAPMSRNTKKAHSQGERAAQDAADRAKRLGILPGNPIYDDMEGYGTGAPNTAAVLAFLGGWSSGLHAAGYLSGVYSSDSSGIANLAHKYHTKYVEPNDIWIADWNGERNAHDPYVPNGDWSHHQRLHQYSGNVNQTYGGVNLTVDGDFLNGATAGGPTAGYLLLTSNGGVHRFGAAESYGGETGKLPPGVTAVALANDHKTGGYWILSSNGAVNGFHARPEGGLKGKLGRLRPVALAASPKGGYLVLTSNGGVHRFGPAPSYGGDSGRLPRGVRAVGLAVDRVTGGYWILRSNGAVNAFHAPSNGGLWRKLHGAAVTGIAPSRGDGYFILTSNGGVHRFGHAALKGSDAGKLQAGVTAVSLASLATASGYRILLSNGTVNAFGCKWFGGLKGHLPTGVSAKTIARG